MRDTRPEGMTTFHIVERPHRLVSRVALPPGMRVRCCSAHACETLTVRGLCDRHRRVGGSESLAPPARTAAARFTSTASTHETFFQETDHAGTHE